MKFLIDAQLPQKLAMALVCAGHEAIHTLNLPDKNRSTDRYIRQLADSEERIVVTKDADFVTSHIAHRPRVATAFTANFYRKPVEHAAGLALFEQPWSNRDSFQLCKFC